MVKVVATNFVQEEKSSEFLELVEELIELTKAKDEGCIKYELYQDSENANLFTFIEEWESRKCLDKHLASKHFKTIVPLLHGFLAKEGTLNIYKRVL